MKEHTSSRDIHFGHYKAAIEDDSLMQMHYNLAEIPFRTGYAPWRWKSATNVMILKKKVTPMWINCADWFYLNLTSTIITSS